MAAEYSSCQVWAATAFLDLGAQSGQLPGVAARPPLAAHSNHLAAHAPGSGAEPPSTPLMWDLSRHSPALGDLKHVLDDSDSWQLLRSPGPGEDAVHWG